MHYDIANIVVGFPVTTTNYLGPGGDSAYEGCKFRFFSHLGCSGQNAIIFGREGLV